MLFSQRPKILTFLPLISPVASLGKISPPFLQSDSPGGGIIIDSYTQRCPGQSPPHPWTRRQLAYESAQSNQSNPPASTLSLPRWLWSLLYTLSLGAGSRPAAPGRALIGLLCSGCCHLDLARCPSGSQSPRRRGCHPVPGPVPPHLHGRDGLWRVGSAHLPGSRRAKSR